MIRVLLVVSVVGSLVGKLAAADDSWQVHLRPHGGPAVTTVGQYTRGEGIPTGVGGFAGARLLAGPGADYAIGLEGSWLATGLAQGDGIRQAVLVGPVAELRVQELVHLDVGLLYAGELTDEHHRYADLTYAVGFAPSWWANWRPLIAYRNDLIFTSALTTVRALTLGVRYTF